MLPLLLGSVPLAAASPCSSKCTHSNCHDFNIRYGNYCGVGHTGCTGIKPCDEYDACCEAHDNCVTAQSVASQPCHARLQACLQSALDNGSKTWVEVEHGEPSAACSAHTIVQTMQGGMQLASLFSIFTGASHAHGVRKLSGQHQQQSHAAPVNTHATEQQTAHHFQVSEQLQSARHMHESLQRLRVHATPTRTQLGSGVFKKNPRMRRILEQAYSTQHAPGEAPSAVVNDAFSAAAPLTSLANRDSKEARELRV
eukprot:CAMPEP_0119325468 /NCGR_PEP_ID=MMETSP1333-20130426/65877_1 /TAXON_ID=418940 /ORGANISM="Scyphosphaera apsteinii, Strain RCC1455" /LENGTH=254 /DNA_ID=CAMNT_0007333457 /DNA_START=70 /DNA_END=834 /DNA_ORIENTATION=-